MTIRACADTGEIENRGEDDDDQLFETSRLLLGGHGDGVQGVTGGEGGARGGGGIFDLDAP
jgi:hypothetical protein